MATTRRDSQRSEIRGQEERCLTKTKDALPKIKDAFPKMKDGPSHWLGDSSFSAQFTVKNVIFFSDIFH
jgi:hypothetical protein